MWLESELKKTAEKVTDLHILNFSISICFAKLLTFCAFVNNNNPISDQISENYAAYIWKIWDDLSHADVYEAVKTLKIHRLIPNLVQSQHERAQPSRK